MKLWLRILCALLVLVMAMAAIGCDKDSSKKKRKDDTTEAVESGKPGDTPSDKPSLPVSYTDTRLSLYDDGSTVIRREYAKDGKLLREHLSNLESCFLPIGMIEYTYDGNKLVRSALYSASEEYQMLAGEFTLESYFLYDHDDKGRAIIGTMYDKEGQMTDTMLTIDNHENGTPKKITYFEDHKPVYIVESDEDGRCVYEKSMNGNAEMTLSYEGDSRQVSSAQYKNLEEKDYVLNQDIMTMKYEYDASGNLTRIYEPDSENQLSFTYASAEAGANLTRVELLHITVDFSYNSKNRRSLMEIQAEDYHETWQIEYTAAGKVASFTATGNDGASQSESFEYTEKGQIAKRHSRLCKADGSLESEVTMTFTYNAADKITVELRTEKYKADDYDKEEFEVVNGYYTISYKIERTYDSANLLSKMVYTQTNPDGSSRVETSYYDTDGRKIKVEYSRYDTNGNLQNEWTDLPGQPGQTGKPEFSVEPDKPPFVEETNAQTETEDPNANGGDGGHNPDNDDGPSHNPGIGGNYGGTGTPVTMFPALTMDIITVNPAFTDKVIIIDPDGTGPIYISPDLPSLFPDITWENVTGGIGDLIDSGFVSVEPAPEFPETTFVYETDADEDSVSWVPTTKH